MKETDEAFTWLMEATTPSIRLMTMADLLHLPPEDERLIQARKEGMESGPIPAILNRQSEAGNWEGERSFYTPKYTSSHWNMVLLTELGVDGEEARFRKGVDYMLETTYRSLNEQMKDHAFGWSCLWGNMLRYVLHSGMGGDARVEEIIQFACQALAEGPCRCEHNWGGECAWGVTRTLWGLAAIPKSKRSTAINEAITQGVDFLLGSYHLVEANYPSGEGGHIHPLWFKLNFPLFYQVDILFTLRVLDELGSLDHPRAQAALDWLELGRDGGKHWHGSSPYRLRTWRDLGDRHETDRWVSLQASRILQHAGRVDEYN